MKGQSHYRLGGIGCEEIIGFALALLLFTLGVNTVAAQLNEDAFPVKIRLLEYAYLEVPRFSI